ncbi:MAG: hypothetical protein OJF49_004071 [Ktedonobacterales bacterium]|jgi:Lon protease-like protein|nr:MAG: hypothetical protein OJF49_004071 [Ktedonobacterales bacterium]
MADERFEVPLFPLNVVLFPGMAMPLHIFEPRYRQMTEDCLADHAPFGVVLLQQEEERETPARIGTLARIADCERLADGRYNLLATGTRRFEIVEVHHEKPKPYLTGVVRPFRDMDEAATLSEALVAEAQNALHGYLRAVLALVGSEDCSIEVPDDPRELSFVIGMCLPCEDCEKQELLELRSAAERLRTGARMLRAESVSLAEQMKDMTQQHGAHDRSILN